MYHMRSGPANLVADIVRFFRGGVKSSAEAVQRRSDEPYGRPVDGQGLRGLLTRRVTPKACLLIPDGLGPRAGLVVAQADDLIPDKGQFRWRFHHPLRYCCPATIFRDILAALFWPAPSG